MKKYCYITTPIYYPNANLHLGHAYTTTLADVMARYKRRMGYEVVLLTGADEHGQKIAAAAQALEMSAQAFVDEKVQNFKSLWKSLDIDYQIFMRTSDPQHKQQVQDIFSQLLKDQKIYKGFYRGLYCDNCAEFLTANQITQSNRCVVCKSTPSELSEPSYFFKIGQQQKFFNSLLSSDKNSLLKPLIRLKELQKNFLDHGLTDFSIARQNVNWGINIPDDPQFTIYVWFDAVCNYISALHYKLSDTNAWEKYWGPDSEIVHFIGKEITRFHAIYWPLILKYLGYRYPDKIVAHGWLIMDKAKMSKSLKNIVNPLVLINRYSSDALRSFLVLRSPLNADVNYSHHLFLEFYNSSLVNDLANLFSRFNGMVLKYYNGTINDQNSTGDDQINKMVAKAITSFINAMNDYDSYHAYQFIFELISYLNAEIEIRKPWQLFKAQSGMLDSFMISLYYSLVVIASSLEPLLTNASHQWLNNLGCEDPVTLSTTTFSEWQQNRNAQFRITKLPIIFNRLDITKELQELNDIKN